MIESQAVPSSDRAQTAVREAQFEDWRYFTRRANQLFDKKAFRSASKFYQKALNEARFRHRKSMIAGVEAENTVALLVITAGNMARNLEEMGDLDGAARLVHSIGDEFLCALTSDKCSILYKAECLKHLPRLTGEMIACRTENRGLLMVREDLLGQIKKSAEDLLAHNYPELS